MKSNMYDLKDSTIFLMIFIISLLFTPILQAADISLTEEEKAWIKDHPTITLSVPNMAPPKFYLDGQGQLVGINIDYMKFIGNRLGVEIKFKQHSTWNNALNDALKHNVDGIPGADKTEYREKHLNFTSVYATYPQGLVTRVDDNTVNNFDDLVGKRVAVKKSSSRVDLLRKNYPGAQIVEVEDYISGLKLLAISKVDVLFAAFAEIYSYVEDEFYVTFVSDHGVNYPCDIQARSGFCSLK